MQQTGLAFISQIIGKEVNIRKEVNKEGYAQSKDWITYLTTSELQKILPIKVDAK